MVEEKLQRIQALLRQVPHIGLAAVQRLFWTELGYDCADEPLTVDLPAAQSGAPRLIARHNTPSGEFKVLHVPLSLAPGQLGTAPHWKDEVPIVRRLQREYPDSLFVFSGPSAKQWRLVYCPRAADPAPYLSLREIPIGPRQPLSVAAERVALLDLTGPGLPDPGMGAIHQRLEAAFEPESLTDDFVRAYRRVAADLHLDFLQRCREPGLAYALALQWLNRLVFVRFLQQARRLDTTPGPLAERGFPLPHSSVRDWLETLARMVDGGSWTELLCRRRPSGLAADPLAITRHLYCRLSQSGIAEESPLRNIQDARVEQIERFLDAYDFVLGEETPWARWLAVSPALMAVAYENLVNVSGGEDQRRLAGVFYTPGVEIDLMCRLSIVDWLANHLGGRYRPLLVDLGLAIEPHDRSSADAALADRGLWPSIDRLLCTVTVLDPSCGCGSFLLGMLSVLNDLRARADAQLGKSATPLERATQIVQRSLYGVELMETAVEIARMRLFLQLVAVALGASEVGQLPQLLSALAAHVCHGDLLLRGADGALDEAGAPAEQAPGGGSPGRALDLMVGSQGCPGMPQASRRGFDIVVGNPPYVRQERIRRPGRPPDPARLAEQGGYKTLLARSAYAAWPRTFGYDSDRDSARWRLDTRSDLYIYFFLQGLALLHAKGALSFVTSSSWLNTRYGNDLRRFLLTRGQIKLIVGNRVHRSFPGAHVNTVLVLLGAARDSRIACASSLDHTARFVSLSVPFRQTLSPIFWNEVDQAAGNRCQVTHDYQAWAYRQGDLLGDDGVLDTTRPARDRWGARHLWAPDIYQALLIKCADRLVRLGSVADIRRGITTGANGFFFLDQHGRARWGIEGEYLVPACKTPRQLEQIWLDRRGNPLPYLFVCHKELEELHGTAALDYIRYGEACGLHHRPTCRTRSRWWDLGQRTGARLHASYLIDSVMRFFVSEQPLLASDNFQELSSEIEPKLVAAACNCTFCQLSVNVLGRTNFGKGLLKLQTYEVGELLIPNPRLMAAEFGQVIQDAGMFGLEDPARRDLDLMVYDLLGLTNEERDSVSEAVRRMVEMRRAKAMSLHR